jgi:hypothetical protein
MFEAFCTGPVCDSALSSFTNEGLNEKVKTLNQY